MFGFGKKKAKTEEKKESASTKNYITASTNLHELLTRFPFAEKVLKAHGIPCADCHSQSFDTVFHAAKEFDISTNTLLEELNAAIQKEVDNGYEIPEKDMPKQKQKERAPPPGMDQFALQQKKINENISHIRHIVAVYSGKGGVGKTTFATNYAAYLASQGKTVCLLDADIDCPNINKVLHITGELKVDEQRKRLIPMEKHKMKVLSMASLQETEDAAIAWRGPMIAGAIRQFLEMTDWGNADYLVIDLPPGTSDAPMTLMQSIDVTGVIIVTTPQDVAVTDAKKSGNLVKKLGARILGVVENMSGDIFGSGGGERAAKELRAPYLGSLPLTKSIREGVENGKPASIVDEEVSEKFGKIVEALKLPQ